ncbi:DUF5004 domain-containing protein [Gramella sp. BOM4]|nr:DUF5004 domain-containing protein [Christiangramia bathymodioli]
MLKMRPYQSFVFLFSFIFLVASCDEKADFDEDDYLMALDSNIQSGLLYGAWKISGMQTNVAVDINGDGLANTNLLDETDCFENMRIEFYEDGGFLLVNSQINVSSESENFEFSCLNDQKETGVWEIRRDKLILHVVAGNILNSNSNKIKFSEEGFSLKPGGGNSAVYLNDPGNVLVPGIKVIELEYSKTE